MIDTIHSTKSHWHEKSIFQTNQLRTKKTTLHLMLVFFSFVASLVLTVIYAEGLAPFPLAAERTLVQDQVLLAVSCMEPDTILASSSLGRQE